MVLGCSDDDPTGLDATSSTATDTDTDADSGAAVDCSIILEPLDAEFDPDGNDRLYGHDIPSGWEFREYTEEGTGGGILGRMTHNDSHPVFDRDELFWQFSQSDEAGKDVEQRDDAVDNFVGLGFSRADTVTWLGGEELTVLARSGLGITERKIFVPYTTAQGRLFFTVQFNLRGIDDSCEPEIIQQMDRIMATLRPNPDTTFQTD